MWRRQQRDEKKGNFNNTVSAQMLNQPHNTRGILIPHSMPLSLFEAPVDNDIGEERGTATSTMTIKWKLIFFVFSSLFLSLSRCLSVQHHQCVHINRRSNF